MSLYIVKAKKTKLKAGLSATALQVTLDELVDSKGNPIVTASFGEWFVLVVKQSDQVEMIKCTAVTQNGNGSATCTVDPLGRNLEPIFPFTGTASSTYTFLAGAEVIVTNDPATVMSFANKKNDETVEGLWTFNQTPLGLNAGAVNDASTTAKGIGRASANPSVTLGTVTMTIANPAVFTLNNHGLTLNDMVKFTTTVSLPTGIVAGTTYYVISAGLTANNFQLATSQGGTAIVTTGSQSGVHTLYKVTPVFLTPTDTFYGVNSHKTSTGSSNAYVLTLDIAPTAYAQGQTYSFKSNFANTTTCTLNVNGLGAKTIKKLDGVTDLVSGDIASGMIVEVMYDNTNFVILNPVANLPPAPVVSDSYILGEAFTGATTPQPARLVNDIVQPFNDTFVPFGSAGNAFRGLKIKPSSAVTISEARTVLRRTTGTDPATNMSVEIQTDNAGVPSGTPVTNGTSNTIATSTLPANSEIRSFNFTFSTPPSLSANTVYHVVIKTSASNANTIDIAGHTNANKYANFDGSINNGSWSAGQTLPYFELKNSAGGAYSLWLSKGNGVGPLNHIDGFVTSTGSAGASGTLSSTKTLSGFSGLLVNSKYYLSTTFGVLTTDESQGMFVGIATNATTLQLPRQLIGMKCAGNGANSLGTTVSGYDASGNSWYGSPMYMYCDGFFTISAVVSPINSTAVATFLYISRDKSNNSAPVYSPSATPMIAQCGTTGQTGATLTIPVSRGDRVQMGGGRPAGGGTNPAISSLYFTPIS